MFCRKYSGMPKSERPKSKQCRNPNFLVFGFQTFGFQTFGLCGLFDRSVGSLMYRTKQKSFGFQTEKKVGNPSKIDWISDVVRNPNNFKPNDFRSSEIQTSSDFSIPLYNGME